MMTLSEARAQPGVVLAGQLNQGDTVTDIAHDLPWEVVEARTHYYGAACVKMRNPHGGIQHFGLATPFRRAS